MRLSIAGGRREKHRVRAGVDGDGRGSGDLPLTEAAVKYPELGAEAVARRDSEPLAPSESEVWRFSEDWRASRVRLRGKGGSGETAFEWRAWP